MTIQFSILFGVIGLFIGSFANLVIYRLRHGGSLILGRSKCPKCRKALSFLDLIPLFSWVFLRGKCRYCRKPISAQYPFVEILFAILWFGVAYLSPHPQDLYTWLYFVFILFLVSSLAITSIYDIKYLEIPDRVIFPTIGIATISLFLPQSPFLKNALLGVFIIYTFFYLQILLPTLILGLKKHSLKNIKDIILTYLIFPIWVLLSSFLPAKLVSKIPIFDESKSSKEEEVASWIGGGDLRLAFLMGLVLGLHKSLVALFIAYILGAIVGIIVLFFQKKKDRHEICFGPFLSIGIFVALFWGGKLWGIYWNLIT